MITKAMRAGLIATVLGVGALSTSSVGAFTLIYDPAHTVITGIQNLPVFGRGNFNVEFVRGTYAEVFGPGHSPTSPAFLDDVTGAQNAEAALYWSLNSMVFAGTGGSSPVAGPSLQFVVPFLFDPTLKLATGYFDCLFGTSWHRHDDGEGGSSCGGVRPPYSPIPPAWYESGYTNFRSFDERAVTGYAVFKSIPEPAVLLLVGVAALGVGAARRRRQ